MTQDQKLDSILQQLIELNKKMEQLLPQSKSSRFLNLVEELEVAAINIGSTGLNEQSTK